MSTFIQELFRVGIYKRNQGRIARQVTFAAVAVLLALGVWRLHQVLSVWPTVTGMASPWNHVLANALPGLLLLAVVWIAYRLVNVPGFADFLVAVEAEMNKVSWPTRAELFRASVVVLVTIFALAAILTLYDVVLRMLKEAIGI